MRVRRARYIVVGVLLVITASRADSLYRHYSSAATYAASSQVEAATLRGAATAVSNSAASGGSAVRFGASASCTVAGGTRAQDYDGSDSAIPAWPHTLGARAIVYYQVGSMSAEYVGYTQAAVKVWNQSPCLDLRVVTTCPASSNCVTVSFLDRKPGTDPNNGLTYFGTFFPGYGSDQSVLRAGKLEYYVSGLNLLPAVGKQRVVTHEMGHSISLSHRKTNTSVMYKETLPTAVNADAVDYSNILAIYGQASAATTGR